MCKKGQRKEQSRLQAAKQSDILSADLSRVCLPCVQVTSNA